VKFDIVVQWVIASIPSCRACSGAKECGLVTLPLAGLALALGMKRACSESPTRPKCVADRPVADLTGKPGNGRLKLGKARAQALY